MTDMQRLIEFSTDASGAKEIETAIRAAFDMLHKEAPGSVRLAYWRLRGTDKFVALIELDDEKNNPLLDFEATAALPKVIGLHAQGGYPTPQEIELVGTYSFNL